MKDLNWTFIIVALILAAAIVGYASFDYFKASNQLAYAQVQGEIKQTKDAKIEACLKEVEATYIQRWNSMCERTGKGDASESNKKECGIPQEAAIHYDSERNKNREFCLKLYK